METIKLPIKNEYGYYEIRLESIGGLGANMCGKMLGELAIKYLNINAAGFSSYGSEKTGTPVKGYIRYSDSDKEIRVHSPVASPNILCIFHEALISDKNVFKGTTKDTIIIVNSVNSSDDFIRKYILQQNINAKEVCTVPAQNIAIQTKSRVNVVMLGAIAKASGFIKLEQANNICKDLLGRKYPDAMEANLAGIKRGFEETECKKIGPYKKKLSNNLDENNYADPQQNNSIETQDSKQEWGYETAPIGGINPRIGNSVISDLSPSRQGYIPLFIKDRCINCGLCDTTCPDMVFQFEKGKYKDKEMMVNKGLDYYHCKGCLRCVEVCPVNALVAGREDEHKDKKFFMPNKEMLRNPDYYEKTGADGYITSESYLTEKRFEGGEV